MAVFQTMTFFMSLTAVSMIYVRAEKPGLEFGALAGLSWVISKVFASPSHHLPSCLLLTEITFP